MVERDLLAEHQIKILDEFSPIQEIFEGPAYKKPVQAEVCRNKEGKIIYVVAKSVHEINPETNTQDLENAFHNP